MAYPTTLDNRRNTMTAVELMSTNHVTDHNNFADSINAIEVKVGINGSAVTTSHDYKLSEITTTDKAVGKSATQTLTNKTLTTPTVTNANMTTPVIPSIYQDAGRTKLMSLPNVASDTLAVLNATQTLKNKTINTADTNVIKINGNTLSATAGTATVSVPNTTDTLMGKATSDVMTNKTFDTAGSGNVFKINTTQVTDKTGTGKMVLDTSPTIVTPIIGQFGSTSGVGAAWTSYVPSLTNLTLGNGTMTGNYIQLGKTIHYRVEIVFGNSSSVSGSVKVGFPVALNAGYVSIYNQIGCVSILDTGTIVFLGRHFQDGSVFCELASGTFVAYQAMSSTVPMTWTTGDSIYISGTYETT